MRHPGVDPIHVLVVDDDDCFREHIGLVLERAGYAVSLAADADEAIDVARRERPDTLLLDVNMPGVSGYDVCRVIRDEFGDEISIIFVSGERREPLDRVAGLLLGADDYIEKPCVEDELLARVRAVARRSSRSAPTSSLTPRELEVVQRLALGRTQRQIADELVISPKTVATHIDHSLAKLGVHSRAALVAAAYRLGLVRAPA